MSKRTLGKRVKRSNTSSSIVATPSANGSLLTTLLGRLTPAQVERLRKDLKKGVSGNISIKYLKAVFFPEFYVARIPYSISNKMTAIVRQMDTFTINTGYLGEGMLFFFPRTTMGPCIFTYLPYPGVGAEFIRFSADVTAKDIYGRPYG